MIYNVLRLEPCVELRAEGGEPWVRGDDLSRHGKHGSVQISR
jgi:hypothetical protein